MANNLLTVKALISMKTTVDGGRQSGVFSGYRPDHIFEMKEPPEVMTAFMGDIVFADKACIEPGESSLVTVRFINSPNIIRYLRKGQKWFINEGTRNVGFGEIVEILA